MTKEEPVIRADVAALGLIAMTNIVVDVLVTHFPHLEGEFEKRAKLKAEEWRLYPATAPYADALEHVLIALRQSARALQRKPPEGSA